MKATRLVSLALAGLVVSASTVLAQNYKIRQVMSMSGQKMESTVYVRGVRKRTESGGMMGFGGDVATIEQCDLKQNVKVNDKKRLYTVDPFDTGEQPATVKAPDERPLRNEIKKGGNVTYVFNVVDTGERKQMFGMTARRIKTSMSIEASPDACTKGDMKMESDGWYIDLPQFSCPITFRPPVPARGDGGGCRDKITYRNSGSANPGFPLEETRTMSMGGSNTFTQTVETLEFSKATLDAGLFEIPQGYAKAANDQDLYGMPDMAAIMKQAEAAANENERSQARNQPTMPSEAPAATGAKRPGVVRIGVLVPSNKGETVSIASLHTFLVEQLNSGGTEAVRVNSEADAKAADCDYLLSSDISKLKQSTAGKVGGLFGKVTSLPTSGGNFEVQVDFRLVSLKTGQAVLQSKASGKTESDAQRAAEAILAQESAAVLGAAKKQ